MIKAADGLEYEDLSQVLLGNPAQTERNAWVRLIRGEETRDEAFLQRWLKGWDRKEAQYRRRKDGRTPQNDRWVRDACLRAARFSSGIDRSSRR